MFMRKARNTRPRRCRNVTWYDPTAEKWQSLAIQKIIQLRKSLPVSEATRMFDEFSRNDAKTQSAAAYRRRFSFASLRLCGRIFFASLVLFVALIPALAQTKSARFDPDGSFWLHGQPPNEFSEFSAINLNAKKVRRLPSPGLQTIDGKTFRFKTLVVKQNNFTFTTLPVNGVSYSFSGKFLKGGVYSSGILDDETPVLEGTLSKFRGGKKLAEAKLK